MSQQLVSHNDDIKRLIDKGYAVAFDNSYLIIRDIPYLDEQQQLQIGAIVATLVFIDNERVKQDDHQIFFAGTMPHNLDGNPISNLGERAAKLPLSEACSDVVVRLRFSNKPKGGGFDDFFAKIESYETIISGPARESFGVTPYTFRIDEQIESDTVFKFHDTLTSRAEIGDLSQKFKDDVVAIIGLGGTGAYVLDFLAKTPVREIRAFDLDLFHVHNAFRSPGRLLDGEELDKTKAEVYRSRYENFRHGVVISPKYIDSSCGEDLNGVTFAFVCVDKGSSRADIFDLLISKEIPFIDVGMGLDRQGDDLSGMLRTNYYSVAEGQKVRDRKLAPLTDDPDDLYKSNIQISELNALNACLAVIWFKQLRGFYKNDIPYHNLLFGINDLKMYAKNINED